MEAVDVMTTTGKAREVILRFIHALNNEDFETARSCLSEDMVFDGVLGRRDGAAAYMNDMAKMKLKYQIEKTFEDGNDVCVFNNIVMSGKIIFTCGWYQLQNKKIRSIRVVFDPRPLLDQK